MKTLFYLLLSFSSVFSFNLRPVPWVTEQAIVFLESYFQTHSNPKILEFGAGSSTVWFAKRTNRLTSVEHDPKWFNFVKETIENDEDANPVNLLLLKRPYYTVCDSFDSETFDFILVDGRNRKGCIANCIRCLKKGGILMLDNSERSYYHQVYHLMKGWKFFDTEQKKPDSCNFWYRGWKTSWWIKPE